jgi:hypothetical protein
LQNLENLIFDGRVAGGVHEAKTVSSSRKRAFGVQFTYGCYPGFSIKYRADFYISSNGASQTSEIVFRRTLFIPYVNRPAAQ